jgi:site-specific recombinase XerD
MARHTRSITALLKGLSLEEIKAILNHKDVKTTQIYARVVSSMKDAAVDKLDMN